MRTQLTALGLIATLAGAAASTYAPPARAQGVNAEAIAQTRFSRGRDAFLARNFEQALTEFRAAYELVPSPNTLLYIARCLTNLSRRAEAYTAFQRAGSLAADRARTEARFAATRDAARTEGAAIEGQIGRITVHVVDAPANVTLTIHGEDLPRAAWDVPTPVDPGAIEVVARAPGHAEFRRSFDVAAGATVEARVELRAEVPVASVTPPPVGDGSHGATGAGTNPPGDIERPPGLVTSAVVTADAPRYEGGGVRIGGFVVAGAGLVAGGVLFGVYGTMAQSRFDQLRMACGVGRCDPQLVPQIDEGAQYQLLANVGLGVAAVGLVAGVIMIAVGGPHRVAGPAASPSGEPGARGTARRGRPASRPVQLGVIGLPRADGGSWIGVGGAF